MEYFVRKVKDAYGELRDEIDPILGMYAFGPVTPSSTSNNVISIPTDKVFYMVMIEVVNNDTQNAHDFQIVDSQGNPISIKYTVPAGKTLTFKYIGKGITNSLRIVMSSYGKLTLRLSGYLGGR